MIRAAKLDANGIYLGMDELPDASALTSEHLVQIDACDLPPGKYKWIPDAENPMGGAFWPIAYLDFQQTVANEVNEERRMQAFVALQRAAGLSRRQAAVNWRKEKITRTR